MRQHSQRAAAGVAALRLAASASSASALTMSDVCTTSYVNSVLPSNDTINGISFLPALTNVTSIPANTSSAASFTESATTLPAYCNVAITYTHDGSDDKVLVEYAFPDPSNFKNRWYVAGGWGFNLNSVVTGGLTYGAVSGATDAGYGSLVNGYAINSVALLANGTFNWPNIYMFSHQALGEMTIIAQNLVPSFYAMDNSTRLYTYYEGCSDGGREGMSQVQRYGKYYDGVIAGAPAVRSSHQQVAHLHSSVVEQTLGYYPPPCELTKIMNLTIAACDPLDGLTDGVIWRTDLCMLSYNTTETIGQPYSCAASGSTPAQNGTVTAEGVAVVQTILDGVHNSKGERAYLSWQIGSDLADASSTWDETTGKWTYTPSSIGGEWVATFLNEVNATEVSLDGVTYDTLTEWMQVGTLKFQDNLQTTLPDYSEFANSGGKLLHFHGESDGSIPAGSSVHWFDSVRKIMNPNMDYNASVTALDDFYRFFLVPGAGHCGTNSYQPNGPYPEDNMATMIDWVENGVAPARLNATVSSTGAVTKLCKWPMRPLWTSANASVTDFECVYDQASIDSWTYTFDAFKMPVY